MPNSQSPRNQRKTPELVSRRTMVLGSIAGLAACSNPKNLLVPAPTIFSQGNGYPVTDVIPSERTATAPVFL